MNSPVGLEDRNVSYFEAVAGRNPQRVPNKPYKYEEFMKLPLDKQFANADKFNAIPEIKEFVDEKWKCELHNRESVIMLANLRKELTEPKLKEAVEFKIRQFIDVIGDQNNVYKSLRLDYKELAIWDLTKPKESVVDWNDSQSN